MSNSLFNKHLSCVVPILYFCSPARYNLWLYSRGSLGSSTVAKHERSTISSSASVVKQHFEIVSKIRWTQFSGRDCLDSTLAFTSFFEEAGPLEFFWVVGLPIHGNTGEGIFEGLTRTGVHHFGLSYISISWRVQPVDTDLHRGIVPVDVGYECNFRSGQVSTPPLVTIVPYLLPSPPSNSNSIS